MSNIKILLHDETQLLAWGESRAVGPWIKLRLKDHAQLDAFRGLDTATATKTGHILHVTIAEGDIAALALSAAEVVDTSKVSDGPCPNYSTQARDLKLSDFFRRPEVWKKIGSDEQFAAWIQQQKCVVCGGGDWVEDLGEQRCEAAHVRRAGESGTGHKADYARVPMCHNHHSMQHQHGETAALCAHIELGGKTKHEDGHEWFDMLRIKFVSEWCWVTLKEEFAYDTWARVPPTILKYWTLSNGLDIKWLPFGYR